MTETTEEILALLIIKKGGRFGNSYGLVRAFEIFFRIGNFVEILNRISGKGYVTSSTIEGIDYFTITPLGQKVLAHSQNETIGVLRDVYPNQTEIIDSLIH